MFDGISDALDVAQTIDEAGAAVLLADGVTTIRAIVDENYTSIHRQFPEALTEGKDRAALFYMTEESYRIIPRGINLTYDSLKWSHQQTRAQYAGNTVIMRICLYSSGSAGDDDY